PSLRLPRRSSSYRLSICILPTQTRYSMDMTVPFLLALPAQKHARTSDLPLLGFVVWWSLSGLRVPHPHLVSAMRSAGFGAYVPHAPSYPKALRRALQAWVSYQAEPLDPWEDEEA